MYCSRNLWNKIWLWHCYCQNLGWCAFLKHSEYGKQQLSTVILTCKGLSIGKSPWGSQAFALYVFVFQSLVLKTSSLCFLIVSPICELVLECVEPRFIVLSCRKKGKNRFSVRDILSLITISYNISIGIWFQLAKECPVLTGQGNDFLSPIVFMRFLQ